MKRTLLAAGALSLTVAAVCAYIWWTTPPQMGGDGEVFTAVDGLFTALAGWRTVAVRLVGLPHKEAQHEADAVLRRLSQELGSADPTRLRRMCEVAVRTLSALPAGTPSLRLLADQTAEVLAGISHALNGWALLVDPARAVPWGQGARLRVPRRASRRDGRTPNRPSA